MPVRTGIAAICLLSWAAFAAAAAPDPGRETIDSLDRAFGYTIGDLVTRKITIRGDAAGFAPELLPQVGPLNAWLAVRDKRIRQTDDGVELTITYQLTGADASVTLIELPVIELRNGSRTLARIDAYPISVSPIMGTAPFVRTGLGDLRPDHQPVEPDYPAFGQRLSLWGGTALTLVALLGWRRWRRNRNPRLAPFAHARKALRRVSDPIEGYRILHRAFDQSAGRSLFQEDVGMFLSERPTYQSVREPIEQFFQQSRSVFFATAESSPDNRPIARLRKLANSLARLEARG